jgi:hypothetical protein
MKGRTRRAGKFRAAANKGKTSIKGVDGRFSAAGRVASGNKIQFILVAEYFQDKAPLCTQSWNASGK